MNIRYLLAIISTTAIIALSGHVLAQNAIYYKYVNKKGTNVISSRIPSEYVKKGYDIVTFDGQLIKSVPPELSEEEKAKLKAENERLKQLKEWDTQLLRRYSHPDDIEAAKQRKLSQNQSRIGLIDLNVEKINAEIDLFQSLAAEDERAGREVSEETMVSIEKFKKDRELELEKKRQKIEESNRIIEEHDRDIARFKVIRPNQK